MTRTQGMTHMKKTLVAILVVSASNLAAAEPLDVKPGMWESTTQRAAESAPMPTDAMAKLSAEQRDLLARAGKQNAAKTYKSTQKSCLSKEAIARGKLFDKADEGVGECKRSIVESSRNRMVSEVVCTGERARTTRVSVVAETPERVETSYALTMARGNKMIVNMTSRWMAADCADTKP
jgi:Protein of unknown function (DUF3617)